MIPENMVNVYIINGLADEYDTQRQLLDSNNATTGKINSMVGIRYERLQTERSAAGSKALAASFKKAAAVQCYQRGQNGVTRLVSVTRSSASI